MPVRTSALPVLESGDNLTQAEFHRRYCARPDIKRAELVEGVVYVGSPVGPEHAEPHATIIGWLTAYRARHPDVRLFDNGTWCSTTPTRCSRTRCCAAKDQMGRGFAAVA